nr:hypothetical protein [uncultured Treponema sp.]
MDTKVFLTIFIILWIGPIIAGVIVAKKKNRHLIGFGLPFGRE